MKNIEFKVRIDEKEKYEQRLLTLRPAFRGTDNQTDTYFNVQTGRLKLREGNIENALIHYNRPDIAGAKKSDIILYRCSPDPSLKTILSLHLGVKIVVKKIRRIYFIENVKFHFDEVKDLGSFVEVEAIDADGTMQAEDLEQQCKKYFDFFGFEHKMLENLSYSDMLMQFH